MKTKILLLSLIALLALPVPCFTQDVEIQGIEIKWLEPQFNYHEFRGRVSIRNTSETLYLVSGWLVVYDQDGFEIKRIYFSGKIAAGETAPVPCRGYFTKREYREVQFNKAVITTQRPITR